MGIAERLKVKSALCFCIKRVPLLLLIASLTSLPRSAPLNHLNLVVQKISFRLLNQAKVVATRDYRVGDNLEGLEGFCAPLTSEEEGILRNAGRLFSVMRKRGQMNLLLGVRTYFCEKVPTPIQVIRFVNHSCSPGCNNVEFVQKHGRQQVKVSKPFAFRPL